MKDLVRVEKQGLYCEAGDFFIDPWLPVKNAVITHAHSDHARVGAQKYFATRKCLPIMKHRLGPQIDANSYEFGEKFQLGNTWVSFHSAGHILGSAQVRIEYQGEVWVLSGDYKRNYDPSCDPFEVVPCDTFVSEATFAVPIYRWESGQVTAQKVYEWWQSDLERPSLLFCYSLGKAQRVLAELTRFTSQKVFLHGAVETLTQIYRDEGVAMLPTEAVSNQPKDYKFNGDLILAPPSAHRSPWMKRFKDPQTAFASGWMQVRGARRRKGYEKGFVLSDHADWSDLVRTIHQTGAKTVFLTHGKTEVLDRFLTEQGLKVRLFTTQYEDVEEGA
ncbi:MAG: ligase-associated DNA damage response exonuclease [Bdellovibrionaceae bacterium]|nr:ligase-associated DNA damage response exonuclease [Pseudobdellovibrionaceae bacterium]